MRNGDDVSECVFLIADLAGYTALTEAHGGAEAAKIVTRYVELAERALAPGVRLIEQVGDALLIVGEDATAVVETAIRLRDAVEAEPLFLGVRCGVHVGPVVRRQGRYFGPALNVSARLAAYARPGQIVCTEAVAAVCVPFPAYAFHPIGPVRFKNVHAEVRVVEIVAPRTAGPSLVVDPVCRMHVSSDTAPARLPLRDRTYHFCSFECAKAFAADPESYARD
jgi:adenylate cyclase